MTKVTIISGFLGAGKTTLIKKLLKEAFKGEKCVLLENEYGEVGIDGGFMKDSGIQITELNSGCICCTLAGDFTDAIGEIVEKFNPDRLLIEPSGVGKLSDIRRVVEEQAQKGLVSLSGSATVVDAAKCKMYLKNFGEFFIDQVKCAETVIFSRSQLVSEEKLKTAFELVRELNADARIITTNWTEIDGQIIVDAIEHPTSLIDVNSLYPPHEHHHDDDEDEDEDEHEHHHHHEHEEGGHEHHHHHDDDDDDDEDEHEHRHHHDDDEDEDEHEHHHEHDEAHQHHHHHH
ncbi:MAG: GTP-binding protein, partial [Clostridia bacterium]|nr:GTP-binding protein [Clostridia bacterium]